MFPIRIFSIDDYCFLLTNTSSNNLGFVWPTNILRCEFAVTVEVFGRFSRGRLHEIFVFQCLGWISHYQILQSMERCRPLLRTELWSMQGQRQEPNVQVAFMSRLKELLF